MKRRDAKMVFLGPCPMCRKKLRDEKLAIIDKNGASALCCVTCVSCESSVMFTVSSLASGIVTTIGILSDAREEDIDILKRGTPVSYDDVLEIHSQLENKKNK